MHADLPQSELAPYRVGAWLPSDHAFLTRWLEAMIEKTNAEARALHPVIAGFRDAIESDPILFMLFSQMFEQVPRRPPYNKDPCGKPQVRDYQHMLQLRNTMRQAWWAAPSMRFSTGRWARLPAWPHSSTNG